VKPKWAGSPSRYFTEARVKGKRGQEASVPWRCGVRGGIEWEMEEKGNLRSSMVWEVRLDQGRPTSRGIGNKDRNFQCKSRKQVWTGSAQAVLRHGDSKFYIKTISLK